jgi:pimeloyl-ACP methyl ester carboxylesterase
MAVIERGSARIWWEARGTGSPRLLTRHTVIAMDNRGVGRSSVPDEQWGIEDMAADAEAVLRAADLGPAHILGLSMGGLVAQELALRSPELVATRMLGCTSPGGPDAILMRPDVAEQFTEWGNLPAEQAAWRAAPVIYGKGTPAAAIKADIDVRMARPTSRVGYGKQLYAVATYAGCLPRLRDLRRPVLVLQGTADLIVPKANADVLLMQGAGHIFPTDAAASAVEAILDFTAEADAQALAAPRPTPPLWAHPGAEVVLAADLPGLTDLTPA